MVGGWVGLDYSVSSGPWSQIKKNIELGMPSKKKKSIWRDIVPTRGGGGKNKLQNVPT